MPIDIIGKTIRIGVNPQVGPLVGLGKALIAHDEAGNPENLVQAQFTNDINAPTTKNVKGRGTIPLPTDIANGDRVFDYQGFGYSGTALFNNLNLRGYVDGAFVSGQAPPMRIVLETGIANSVPAERIAVFSNGFVAIGSDQIALGVGSQAGIVNVGGNSTVEGYVTRASTDINAPRLIFRKYRGTLAAPANSANGDAVMDLVGQSRATVFFDGAMIRFAVADAVVGGQQPASRIEFYTNPNNTAASLRAIIDRDGQFGSGSFTAGSVEPEEQIHSRTPGANALQWALQLQNPNNTNNNLSATGLLFGVDTNGALAKSGIAYYRDTTDWGRGRLRIFQNDQATATKPTISDTVVQIENNGNVGIARRGLWSDTELPAAHLHILGEGAPDLHVHIEKAAGAGVAPGLLEFYRSRGTIAARTNVADTDVLGRISSFGYATTYQEAAYQHFTVDGAVVAGQIPPSRVDFFTGIVNVAASRAVSIRANGNIHAGPATEIALTSLTNFDGHLLSADAARHLWLARGSDTNGFNLLFSRARTSMAAPTNVVDADRIIRIEGYAYSGATGYWATARIDSNVDGAVTDNQRPGSRLTFWTNSANAAVAERMRITGAGKVGIGVTPDSDKLLHVEISQTATSFFKFRNTANASNAHGGMIQAGSNTTAGSDFLAFFRPDGTFIGAINQNAATTVQYLTSSDARLKENDTDAAPALERIAAIRVREFNYKGHAERMTGFIAQELHAVYPEAVSVGEALDADGKLGKLKAETGTYARPWGVDYGRLTPLLVKAIQELSAEVAALKAK